MLPAAGFHLTLYCELFLILKLPCGKGCDRRSEDCGVSGVWLWWDREVSRDTRACAAAASLPPAARTSPHDCGLTSEPSAAQALRSRSGAACCRCGSAPLLGVKMPLGSTATLGGTPGWTWLLAGALGTGSRWRRRVSCRVLSEVAHCHSCRLLLGTPDVLDSTGRRGLCRSVGQGPGATWAPGHHIKVEVSLGAFPLASA